MYPHFVQAKLTPEVSKLLQSKMLYSPLTISPNKIDNIQTVLAMIICKGHPTNQEPSL